MDENLKNIFPGDRAPISGNTPPASPKSPDLQDEKIAKMTESIRKDERREFKQNIGRLPIPDISKEPPIPPIEIMPQSESESESPPKTTFSFKPTISSEKEAPKPALSLRIPPRNIQKGAISSSPPSQTVPIIQARPTPPPKPKIEIATQEMPREKTEVEIEREKKQEFYSIVKPLQTYERDVAESIRGGETVMSINTAAQKRREERHETAFTEKVAKNSMLTIVSGVLIVAAIAIFGIVFYAKWGKAPVPIVPEKTIISTDVKKEFARDSIILEEIVIDLENAMKEGAASNALVEITFKESAGEKIPLEKFLRAFALNIPDALLRSWSSEWIFGFHAVPNNGNEPFLAIKILSFDNAYAGMLQWEKDLAKDLYGLFINRSGVISTAPLKEKFEDMLVKSKDVRVLKNVRGEIVLMYSFIDSKHLAITTNEKTLREILTRHQAAGLIR